jgi:hypothetical protein
LYEPRLAFDKSVTYVYSENKDSITRRNDREYKFTGLEFLAKNLVWAAKEYLNNYKEHKLAEFCVQRDMHIESLKRENHDYAKKLTEMREKVEKYDKTFESVKELYAEIKKLSVDDYLKLYKMMNSDVTGTVSYTTISSSGITSINGSW